VRLSRLEIGAFVFCMLAGVASASSFSFSGTFTQDDQRQLFLFTAPSSDVLLRTWSYAGGTDAAGGIVAPGGFDPALALFDATGGFTTSSLLVDSTTTAPEWLSIRSLATLTIRCSSSSGSTPGTLTPWF